MNSRACMMSTSTGTIGISLSFAVPTCNANGSPVVVQTATRHRSASKLNRGGPRRRPGRKCFRNTPQGADLDAEYGRGLAIVAALADKLGHDITVSGQNVWAEVGWADTIR